MWRRLGGWVGLGGEETGESVSDGMQPDGLMVLHVVQQVWTCGGGWRLCRLCRTGYQGSQLKGKAPCRKSRHQQLDGGAASPCVGEAMIPLGCATQLNPPPTTTTHPRSPITWRALIQNQQYSCQSPGEAITHQPRHRKRLIAAHTPPADAHVTGRPLHGGVITHSESTAGILFPFLDDSHSKKKKRLRSFLTVSNFFFFFSYSCTVSCFILYWAANTRSFISA